jgi:LmbE family N-acetylglucosaminyl deacetylase
VLWLLVIPAAVILGWLAAIVAATDLTVPAGDLKRFKTVLIVFPHADDETMNCGGTIYRLATAGAAATLVLLTGGERGNPAGVVDARLQATRRKEAEQAARILGVTRLIQQDFGDGALTQNREAVTTYLESTIRTIEPDLLVTYDRAGLDGHPDHVACAEILMELKRTRFPDITLWCAALPDRLVSLLRLARQLDTELAVEQRRASPTWRILVGSGMIPKIHAWYAYRSQRAFIAKGLGRVVPVWLAVSAMQFEYFAEVG